MATTRGEAEPEVPVTPVSERFALALAGNGVVRRVALYTVMFASMGLAFYAPFLVVPAIVCGVLLLATDSGVSA